MNQRADFWLVVLYFDYFDGFTSVLCVVVDGANKSDY